MLIALTGCDDNPAEVEDYDPEPMLTAFLYNGEPLTHVFLERVAPINGYFLPLDHFISGADIILFPVDNPQEGDTLEFVESASSVHGWIYRPAHNELFIPQSLVRYRIEVRKPSENIYLWAETTIPDTFTLEVSPYEIEFDSITVPLDWNDTPISLRWTESEGSASYVFSSVALEMYPLIPLDPEMDPDDMGGTQEIEILNKNSTGIDIPWMNFEWVGWHWIQIQAVNLEQIEYLQSLFVDPNINPIFNVQGGLGIFSGMSRQDFYVNLQRVQ